ncbi:hypothetical protein LBMAG41_10660 [Cyanobium sp.]|nr:hypothetical protein LBMAG41_10660 [Cyanobium sp.]
MARRRSDEGKVSADIGLAFGHGDCRLLRNNVGMLPDRTGRPVAYGLGSMGGKPFRGSLDWIGWRTVTITPDMVGRRIAIFAAIDAKDMAKPRPEQITFTDNVLNAGGLAGFAHNLDEAQAILFPPHLPPAL